MKTLLRTTVLILVIVLVAACGGAADNATPVPASSAEATAPAEAATSAPAATATALPEPTATDVPAATPTEEPTATPEPPTATPEPAAAVAGPCYNDFFPVVEGASWTYNTTGVGAAPSSYTQSIAEAGEDGFTLTHTIDGNETVLSIDYACGEDGLSSATLGGLPGAAGGFSMQVTSFTGTNFPPSDQWKVGATWAASSTVEGGGTIQDIEAVATGTVDQTYDIVALESVTVPAGDFDAYKVNLTLTEKLALSMNGTEVPVEFTTNSTQWYAEGVGLIKSVTEGDFASTTELASYEGL